MHIASLEKRYREILGEIKYHERLSRPAQAHLLGEALSSIGEAIRILDPAASLADLRPIRYRPPEHLPGAALTRAALAALQTSGPVPSVVSLARIIAVEHGIEFNANDEWHRFVVRLGRVTSSLKSRHVIGCRGSILYVGELHD